MEALGWLRWRLCSNNIITARIAFAQKSRFSQRNNITTITQSGAFNIIVDDTCHCQRTRAYKHSYADTPTQSHRNGNFFKLLAKKLLLASPGIRKFILPPNSINFILFPHRTCCFSCCCIECGSSQILFARAQHGTATHTHCNSVHLPILVVAVVCQALDVSHQWLFNFILNLISCNHRTTMSFKNEHQWINEI